MSTLLKIQLKIIKNNITATTRTKRNYILVFIIALIFMYLDYLFFKRSLEYINSIPSDVGEILIIQLMNTLNLVMFSMLLFSNIISSLSTLYLSKDLEMLVSSPVTGFSLYISRLFISIGSSSWMVILFGLPIFIVYGQIYNGSFFYYPAMLLSLILFILLPGLISSILIIPIVKYIPIKRTHQVLSILGIAMISAIVIFLRFTQPEKYFREDIQDEAVIGFVEALKTPDYILLPSSLFTSSLKNGAFAEWELYFYAIALLIVYIGIALFIGFILSERLYIQSWSESVGATDITARLKDRFFYKTVKNLLGKISPSMSGFIIKDIKLFWREPGQWSQLLVIAALIAVYLFNIKSLPITNIYFRNIISVGNIGLAGVVLSAIAARFVFGSVSFEGGSFWVVKSAPIDPSRFLLAKFLIYIIPMILLAEILIVVSNLILDADRFVMIISALTILGLSISLTGLAVGMGAIFPRLKHENQAEVGSGAGALIFMIVSLLLAGVSIALIALPVRFYLLNSYVGAGLPMFHFLTNYILLAATFISATVIPMILGARSIKKHDL